VLDLMALNFLIAIFSQSYESIMDRQIESIIESKIELNQECLQELNNLDDEEVQADIDIIVMQTAINFNADSEWNGIAQTIKKSLDKVQKKIEANQKELKKENQELKNELNTNQKELIAKFDKEMAEIKAMLIKIN
jgi:DNA replication protein DnaD